MAPSSTSKRSSRASSSSSRPPAPKPKATSKSKLKAKVDNLISDDEDVEEEDPSSDDIDGSDFEESEQKKRKAEDKERGGPNKKRKDGSDDGEDDDEEADVSSEEASEGPSEIEDSDEDEEEIKTKGKGKMKLSKDGITVVRQMVKAPATSVPAGQVSSDTLSFLADLAQPGHNDREWFWANEPRYRSAEKEWNAFVDALTEEIGVVDDEIPFMPAKDLVHRIYRDIRFSNNKTPYKTNLSASLSRTGRKGIFAHYHVMIAPNGRSMLAAGIWGPEKDQLGTSGLFTCVPVSRYSPELTVLLIVFLSFSCHPARPLSIFLLSLHPHAYHRSLALTATPPTFFSSHIRSQFILTHPKRLRRILSKPEFVAEFGEPEPFPPELKKKKAKPKKKAGKKGKGGSSDEEDDEAEESEQDESTGAKRRGRRSVFGGEDALKVAPKGIPKDHRDIDLLKLRSVAVIKHFTDDEVTSPTWQAELLRVVAVVLPFVHLLNEMVAPPDADEDEEDPVAEEDGEAAGDDEDDE